MTLALKRTFDLIATSFASVVLAPMMLVIAALIRINSPGPILYRAIRVGRNGDDFVMLKFRTMVVDADRKGASSTSADDPRITAIGRFLRRFKLDELPQLWNVVRGDMSVVGPDRRSVGLWICIRQRSARCSASGRESPTMRH